jgi:hypothetical protein
MSRWVATDHRGGRSVRGTTHEALATRPCTPQEYRISIFDLAVPQRGGDDVAAAPELGRLATFPHRGAVTAIEAAEVGSGSVYLIAASAEGHLTRLRLQVPTAPGSAPEAVQLQDDFGDGGDALPAWIDVHKRCAVVLDLNAGAMRWLLLLLLLLLLLCGACADA